MLWLTDITSNIDYKPCTVTRERVRYSLFLAITCKDTLCHTSDSNSNVDRKHLTQICEFESRKYVHVI